MSSKEADKQKGKRIHSGAAPNVPEHWEHKRYMLTMTMLDTFNREDDPCGDELNVLATTIYRRMWSEDYTPDDIIYGTVYIGNETATEIIDFTKEDLAFICKLVFKPQIP